MKKIFIIIFILSSLFARSQTPVGYTQISARYKWIGGIFDSSFQIPVRCGVDTVFKSGNQKSGQMYFDSCGNKLWVKTTGKWIGFSSGAGGGGSGISELGNVSKS